MRVNVYDFDKTIYRGDSTLDFWRYCVRRHPRALAALPGAAAAFLNYKRGAWSKERWKGSFYRFLTHVPDVEGEVTRFWDAHMGKIEPWYLRQRAESDLIISASPEFLVRAACDRLGVRCIASQVEPATGRLLGPNCRGEEKVRRFRAECAGEAVTCFYSDSRSDAPLAALAERAYLVRKGRAEPWT